MECLSFVSAYFIQQPFGVCRGSFLVFFQPRPQSPLASFDVTSALKLVGRTRLGRLAINGKSKMAERGQVSNFSQRKRQPRFVSTIYNVPQMFGRNVFNLYIRNIPWSSQKKSGFRRAISGTFSRWTGTFLPFCARPSRYCTRFQAFSCHPDSENWPGEEAGYTRQFFLQLAMQWSRMKNIASCTGHVTCRNLSCSIAKSSSYFSCNLQCNILLHCKLQKWGVTWAIIFATCL